MIITVKSVKEHKELSDDSLAFSCSVYVDGRRAFTADNNGNGGCTMFRAIKPLDWSREQIKAAEAHCATLPEEDIGPALAGGEPLVIQPDLDWVVTSLAVAELEARDWKRKLKGETWFRNSGDEPNTYTIYAHPYNDAMKEHMAKRHPGAVVMNEKYEVFA